MKQNDVVHIFGALRAANPEPKGELEYVNVYTLLVAVVLSAQATDKGVNAATRALFKVVDTPQKMLALGEDGLKGYIKTIGLFNGKAKNIIALSRILVDEHEGQVPEDFDALVALPGVGRKTANVVMNIAFGAPTIAVDTHVFRVSHRTGLVSAAADTPDKVEAVLHQIIPAEFLRHAHHWLILQGRYTCTARAPKCESCVIAKWCASFPQFAGKAGAQKKPSRARA